MPRDSQDGLVYGTMTPSLILFPDCVFLPTLSPCLLVFLWSFLVLISVYFLKVEGSMRVPHLPG